MSGPNSKSFVRFLSPNADRGEQGRPREKEEGRGSAANLSDEPRNDMHLSRILCVSSLLSHSSFLHALLCFLLSLLKRE